MEGKHYFPGIGIGGNMDHKENGVLMPDSPAKANQMRRQFYHCGSHAAYSKEVQEEIDAIASDYYDNDITKEQARQRISAIQSRNRALLKSPAIPGLSPVRLS
ncbi:hypothetical protein C4Q28_01115 [Pseudomonas sp. SWI6]|uniref:AHH domain-containing protein n=1 Tax=Pseudomonas TaxID=286 RepID=UPI000CE5EF21|nr:hypothetical protein C4Q28_01115 [Pseudomonas sp. SWI6]